MKRELLQILNERKVLAALILLPIVFTVIFGGLFYKNLVTGVPIIVVNLDDGLKSQSLIRNLTDMPEVEVIAVDGAAADITIEMLKLEATGAVVIPKDYSQKISRGENVAVELIVDNTNTVLGGTVTRAVQSVITNQSAEILVTDRIAAGWNAYQAQNALMTLSTRVLYNPTGGYSDFFLTVLILHSMQIAIVFMLAPNFVNEKKLRPEIFERPLETLTAKILIYTVIGTAIATICLAIGIQFFGLICRGSFLEIMLIVMLFVLSMVTFSLSVGALLGVDYYAVSFTLAYIMPSILFTGAIWPKYSMDSISLALSYLLPISYAANDLRNLFLKGVSYGWEMNALMLLIFSAVFFAIGWLGLKLAGGNANVRDNASRITPAD